eukprot:gene12047-15344_t
MLAPYDPLWENSSDSVPRPEGAEAGAVDRSEPRRAVSEGVTAEDLLALPTPAVSSDDLGARPTAARNGLETRPMRSQARARPPFSATFSVSSEPRLSSKSNESGYDVDAETETLQILQSRIEYLSVSLTVLQDELATSQAILSDLVSARLRRRRGFGSEKALSVRREEGGEGKEADNVASADESVKGIREKRAEYFASVGLRSA